MAIAFLFVPFVASGSFPKGEKGNAVCTFKLEFPKPGFGLGLFWLQIQNVPPAPQ